MKNKRNIEKVYNMWGKTCLILQNADFGVGLDMFHYIHYIQFTYNITI